MPWNDKQFLPSGVDPAWKIWKHVMHRNKSNSNQEYRIIITGSRIRIHNLQKVGTGARIGVRPELRISNLWKGHILLAAKIR